MDKKFLAKQEELLEEKKIKLERQLSSFAKKSDKIKGDWTAKMPSFDEGQSLEEEADEVEEFSTRLALERTLEQELKDVNLALDNLKKGKYGLCQKCGKAISQGRLRAYPQAQYCTKCQ